MDMHLFGFRLSCLGFCFYCQIQNKAIEDNSAIKDAMDYDTVLVF